MFLKNFIKCGVAGWCMEVVWTGIHSFTQNDFSMMSKTSVLMFPIYGLAALIRPLSHFLDDSSIFFRGMIYMLGIFAAEYTTGSILKSFHICPWNYENAKYNIHGLIRLDYAPAWFSVGLFFEKLLNPGHGRKHTFHH